MCYLEKKIMKSSPTRFNDYYYENCPDCCESISLGGFIAKFRSKKTCADITDEDVNGAMKIIQSCSVYFVQGLLKQSCSCDNINEKFSPNCPSVPCVCSWKSAVYLALNELTDSEFLKTPSQTNLKYSAILSPIKWSSYDLFNNIYETHLKDSLPEYKGVKVAGFDFGNFRFDLFNVLLVENAKYPAIAMVFVLIIMCFFLKSIILSFCALLTILFALVLSYFLYNVVFGIKFFPFLNVITLVFLVGIGADDAFVYYDIFRQTKSANPNDGVLTLTLKTLRYAALSMFVTSFTTSAAFFANLSSHITSIRLFGIYAGLSILTNYLLMITWFPIIVVLHERWVRKRKADQIVQPTKEQKEGGRFEEMGNNPHGTPSCEEIDRDGKGTVHLTAQYSSGREEAKERSLACLICWGIDFPCHFIARSNTFFSSMSHKLFETWLPSAVIKKRLYLVWIFLFVGLTVGFLCVSFVSPKLKLPTSKGFQVFSSSSSIEQYNLHIEQKFRYAHKNAGGLWVELVWGLKPLDNGNYLNPDEKGTLQYDDSFDPVFTAASQKWLSSFCKSLASQPFYTNTSWAGGSLCRMEEVIRICSPPSKHACCGNATFPYPKNVIENCKVHTATPDIYYDIQSGKARAMRMYFSSNVAWTAEYEKMDTFWNQLDSWSKKQFSEAPSTFKNGWIVCRNLDSMYSLQYSLQKGTISSMGISIAIAFGVMLLTTLNIFISVYAIITIIGIIAITIGCLVLLGWQLSVLESIVMSVSVGLSIDFTMHYGVAYRLSPHKDNRQERVRYSFIHIGSAILMAAVTTFVTGNLH
ncbi:hypothetical protein QZH41_006138 [Actinostola sp. cb2023]|nr:hypothetical protein QZH41_006138 [Actinostola sp. cb2023]